MYPRPQLNAITLALITQILNWDSIEGCWELMIPLPPKVSAKHDAKPHLLGSDLLGIANECHEVLSEIEGLEFDMIGCEGDQIFIGGLRY